MINKISRNDARKMRHHRIRENIIGTSETPRLNVLDLIRIFLHKSSMMKKALL
jgi:ribosomal protein L18